MHTRLDINPFSCNGGESDFAHINVTIPPYLTDNECESVQDLVKEINSVIRPFQQKIKITHDEITHEEVLLFLSMADDDISKAQNYFSATELEYFRVLLEQIVTTDSRQITRINALNIVGSMKSSFSKTEADVSIKYNFLINKFVKAPKNT